MTSKISFSKLVRLELHHMSWLTALQMLAFILLLPFRVLMALAMYDVNPIARDSSMRLTAVEVFCKNVGLGHLENTLVILVAGGICALCAFSYVHSAVKQDFYHSLSLKRERLFAVKYVSSVLTFVIAYLISQLLTALLGVLYQAITLQAAFEIALASVQGILFFLCSYSGVLVALMLTGKMLTTVFAVGVFGCYGPLLYLLHYSFREVFLTSGLFEHFTNRARVLSYTSPWAFCLLSTGFYDKGGVAGKTPDMGNLCQLVAVAAVLSAIALLLYRVRKSEAASSALAFRRMEPVVKLAMGIPVSLIAGLVAYEFFGSPVWELGFILLFGTLTCLIIEFVYRLDIRQVLSNKWPAVVTVVLGGFVFFAFRYDLTGYNTYLPEKEKLASMAVVVSYNGMNYPDSAENDRSYYLTVKKKLNYLELQEFDPIYAMAENGVSNTDGSSEEARFFVYIKYHLTDGREIYRSYYVDEAVCENSMDTLMENETFLKQYFPIFTWDEQYMGSIEGISCDLWGDYDYWFGTETPDETGKSEQSPETAGEESEETVGEESEETVGEESEETVGEESPEITLEEDSYEYIDIRIPVARLAELREAYLKDLGQVGFQDTVNTEGNLIFQIFGKTADWYKISPAFTNTLAIIRELYDESPEPSCVSG